MNYRPVVAATLSNRKAADGAGMQGLRMEIKQLLAAGVSARRGYFEDQYKRIDDTFCRKTNWWIGGSSFPSFPSLSIENTSLPLPFLSFPFFSFPFLFNNRKYASSIENMHPLFGKRSGTKFCVIS